MRFSTLFLILLVNFCSGKEIEVPCESVIPYGNGEYSCFMQRKTAITEDNVKISYAGNEEIAQLWFDANIKIFFLPIDIYEKMPNLYKITAFSCSISTISKKNFIKLTKLNVLSLGNNKIETIASDVFDDLVKLQNVNLDRNRIKFINGKLFENKPELKAIYLSGNVCIDEGTGWSTQEVQSFLPKITAQCGFDESNLLGSKCGIVSNIGVRIIGGNEIMRGQWPFLVALILASNGKLFCGGNLMMKLTNESSKVL